MKKFLIGGVSLFAILSAVNANAAGYTCEELIEYTSCNPGYYLNASRPTCPDGYSYITGACHIEEDPSGGYASAEECAEAYCDWYGDCEDISEAYDNYLGDGCLKSGYDEEVGEWVGYDFIPASDVSSSSTNCIECPAGSSCNGGTEDKQLCAAGTYQPNTKQSSCLTTPKNNYSLAGAVNYTPCPATNLTDKDGKTVTATTAGDGATSIMSCYVGSEWYFKNAKGTYHFTSNCNAFDMATATAAQIAARCQSMGGNWQETEQFCEIQYDTPTTESACDASPFCYLEDGNCQCDCSVAAVDLETGQQYCKEN